MAEGITGENYDELILHRDELRRRQRHTVPAEIEWMIQACSSSLFEPIAQEDVKIREKQSYQIWKAQFDGFKMIHPFRAKRNSIQLQPLTYESPDYLLSEVNQGILDVIEQFLSVYFGGLSVHTTADVDISRDRRVTRSTRVHSETNRKQVLVDDAIKCMKKHRLPRVFAVVGLTLTDLYPSPEWNFTLGHAVFREGVAICSYGRQFNSSVTQEYSSLYHQFHHIWVLLRVSSPLPLIMMMMIFLIGHHA
jgi:archaemetzincin